MTDAIDTGEILEALNEKVDRDCENVDTTSGADVVVEWQAPDASNDYKWYRKYKSGWIEQGGIQYATNSVTAYTITFLKAMADSNYTVTIGCGDNTANANVYLFQFDRTTDGFKLYSNITSGGVNVGHCWRVEGMSAVSV